MGPYVSKNFKTLLLLQITAEIFKLLLNFIPSGPHKTTFGIFEILKIEILIHLFSFSKTWDPMGVKSQNAATPTIRIQMFSNLSCICLPMVLTKIRLGFLEF